MHELAVTESLLEIALEHARRHGAARVVRVNLRIGALSDFMEEAIRQYFEILSEGTLAAEAALAVGREPVRAVCEACGREFTGDGPFDPPIAPACPDCGSREARILSGRELHVESIEIE